MSKKHKARRQVKEAVPLSLLVCADVQDGIRKETERMEALISVSMHAGSQELFSSLVVLQ